MAQSADHTNFVIQLTGQPLSESNSRRKRQLPSSIRDDKADSATGTGDTSTSTSLKAHAKKISNPSSLDSGEGNKTNVNCVACEGKTNSYPQIGKGLCDICQRFFRLSGPRISKPTTSKFTGRTED